MNEIARHHIDTPIGPLTIELSGGALTRLEFGAHGKSMKGAPPSGLAAETARQLEAYFAGRLEQFDLPLRAEGTPFRQKVWRALRAVPYAQTRSYGEIAKIVESAPRAVGGACGANPIAIVVPCHRIVGAGGRIGGFSGGEGCATKQLLLEHEAARPRRALRRGTGGKENAG